MNLLEMLRNELLETGGKISPRFIDELANHSQTKVTHCQVTPNTRVCVVTLPTGHDLVGYAQVLDAKNDVELIGQEVAYKNAIENLWAVCGSIAKIVDLTKGKK